MAVAVIRFDLRQPGREPREVQQAYSTAVEMSEWADAKGFDLVVLSEHHGSPDGYLPSPLVLAGAMAAHSTLPVIGVPLDSSPLGGFDALLATVQMPPGVPVAAVGVGSMGAKNAGHLAVAILALQDDGLRARLQAKRKKMAEEVVAKAATLPDKLRKLLGGA